MNRIVQEEVRFADRMEESWRFSGNRPSVGMLLELFGWRLDHFYELMGPSGVEMEDRDHGKKKKVLYARTGSPRIQVEIEPRYAGGKPGPAGSFQTVWSVWLTFLWTEASVFLWEGIGWLNFTI